MIGVVQFLSRGQSICTDTKTMSNLLWILFSYLYLSRSLEAYKALVVVPLPSKSHGILGNSLVQLIVDAGNEVTYLTSFPRNKPLPGVKEIGLDSNKKMWRDSLNLTSYLNGETNLGNKKDFVTKISYIYYRALQNKQVQILINNKNENFDVIIVDWMYSDVFAGLAAIFDCPLIWLSTLAHNWETLQLIDAELSPVYSADVFSANQPPFSFVQRIQELGYRMSSLLLEYLHTSKIQNTQYESIIAPCIRKRGKPVPNFEELRFNGSLILGITHISLGNAVSLPENYKEVAGYHIAKDVKPVRGHLKILLDNAKHGVIYFSLGSNLRSNSLPIVVKDGLLKMFGQLQQTILWKFEEDIPHKPDNVHIVRWAPQHSILAHQNCILFITHGGFLSNIEAVHFGKPIIGIPVYGDQFGNVATAVRLGYAKKVDMSYTMADELQKAIQETMNNLSYTTRAKELSFIYFHRTALPAAELVYWVDHVVKTRGALHLRSHALQLRWYQKMYLDLVLLILVIILALKILITRLYIMCRKKRNQKKKEN